MAAKKLPIFSDKKCSNHFYHSFCHHGAQSIDCTACGRHHFCTVGDYEGKELERLQKLARENPDKYIQFSGDVSIGYFELNGKQAVTDCPCNYARQVEDFILENQSDILEFLDRTSKEELETATTKRKDVQEVKTTLKRLKKKGK